MAPTWTVSGLLDPILPKHSDFGRYSNNIAILDVVLISEMKYDCKNLTEFLELEFFVPEIFVNFFHRKTSNFSIHAENSSKKARKNLNKVFC